MTESMISLFFIQSYPEASIKLQIFPESISTLISFWCHHAWQNFLYLFILALNKRKKRVLQREGLKCDGKDWDFSIMISERNKIYEKFSSFITRFIFFIFSFENIIVADDKSATRDDDDVLQSTSSFIKFYL